EKYFSIPASWTQRLYASHPGDQERLASLDSRFAGYKNLYQPSNYPGNAAQARYQELHKKFQPYVEEYGQKMKENRESKDPRRAQYASMSLFSASQTCVHSALGGIREGY
ncbi:MAG TPA: hypothetical protein VN132_06255, partial [Bdellovibrio sp.]|nr:hypothetical protein [Bdellovibrio sp.]